MKLLRLILVAFVPVFLPACGSQASVQPVIATGSLDTAEAYLRRGDSYSDIQDYDRAIADYDQAIRLKPDYAEAYNKRGYASYWKGEAADAIDMQAGEKINEKALKALVRAAVALNMAAVAQRTGKKGAAG